MCLNALSICAAIIFALRFFCEYQDPDTNLKVRKIKDITKQYFWSMWLILDFVATFPFDKVAGPDIMATKLIRLLRLTKLFKLLDANKF